ncbi:MAG TPA: hypothetical protein VE983_04610, partial [Solirubrobacteraceae bacterium]|nr:hypothetical protein [Solirubrobacteraceae bacterium]
MNAVRIIPRITFKASLRLIRLPVDLAINLLPAGRQPAKLAVERADATARAVAGTLLGDAALRDEADRLYRAADARQQATELRDQAEEVADHADARVHQRQQQASRRRQAAENQAGARRRQARQRQGQKVRRAAEVQEERLQDSERTEAVVEQAIEEEAPRARLDALDAQT